VRVVMPKSPFLIVSETESFQYAIPGPSVKPSPVRAKPH
jgi:hypothetical protein